MRGERGLHELYRDDTERAAALVFGRRGLLKGAGLTAMAAVVGTAIPFALSRTGIDPAIASGVLLTTVTDVIAFLAFLGLAAWFLV